MGIVSNNQNPLIQNRAHPKLALNASQWETKNKLIPLFTLAFKFHDYNVGKIRLTG